MHFRSACWQGYGDNILTFTHFAKVFRVETRIRVDEQSFRWYFSPPERTHDTVKNNLGVKYIVMTARNRLGHRQRKTLSVN